MLYSIFMSDLATFRKEDIEAVHGTFYCVGIFTCRNNSSNPVEWHHILGRGNKKDNESRKMHSSILNAVPLENSIHAGGQRDKPKIREFFLEEIFTKVMRARASGKYELSDIDRKFLSYARNEYPNAYPDMDLLAHIIYT